MTRPLDAELQLFLDTDSRTLPSLPNNPAKTNWVEKAGGLPSYIERIAKHLHFEKGKSVGHSIAIAVNTCKRWCSSGAVTGGGIRGNATEAKSGGKGVSAATKAKACKAVAEWEAKKAKSHALSTEKEKLLNMQGELLLASDYELVQLATLDVEHVQSRIDFDPAEYQAQVAQRRRALRKLDT